MLSTLEPKAVIFDMDGTLVDSIPFHKKAWLTFLEQNGILLSPEAFHAENHGTLDEMMSRFFGNTISDAEKKALGQEKERVYRNLYAPHVQPIDGLVDYLKQLSKKNIKMALATMGDASNIDFILEALDIRSYFDAITGGHEVSQGKPHPEIFIQSLEKLGVRPEEAIVFEDSEGGIQAAKAANIPVVGITTSHSEAELRAFGCFAVISDYRN